MPQFYYSGNLHLFTQINRNYIAFSFMERPNKNLFPRNRLLKERCLKRLILLWDLSPVDSQAVLELHLQVPGHPSNQKSRILSFVNPLLMQ